MVHTVAPPKAARSRRICYDRTELILQRVLTFMLFRSLHTAASGMDAYIFNLDVIANNLANAGTTSYKRSRSNFQDIYYQQFKLPGQQDSNGNLTGVGVAAGLGARVAATQMNFEQGSLLDTGRRLDVAIVGDGFFQLQDTNQPLYSRNGTFTVNENGDLIVASADIGRRLDPPITIPNDAIELAISPEGIVSVLQPGSPNLSQVGTIQLVRFINPEGLLQKGDTLYAQTDASGTPIQADPGQQGLGTLRQGYLEISNAEPVEELVELIKTQRNVELNSQVIKAADQLLQLVANLRQF